ncbi:minor tail protein [Streptomyces phage Issmi]|uniref:Minor tail protein n=1 Tax=Streptomyces phage Issmi TaxID=2725628 RepID=A0A6M3SYC6_9CAUD|nr:minor tail protein [Streptomyces phage Issmi]QJD50669.1 minor tail protein [Streptomyces phage Issmi]
MGFSVVPEPAISGLTGPQGPPGTVPSDPVFTGSVGVDDTAGDPNVDIKKSGKLRWKIRSAGTESGSNNGSDLWIESFADDGTTKIGDPIWISRTGTQVVVGQADSVQGGVKLSVNGAIGTRDLAADPATTSMGAQLYSKAGKLWAQTANGAEVFQVVDSLPSKANATLSATYMNIDKAAGNYRAYRWLTAGVSRWEAQVDDVAESGSAAGSDFRLSARNDDGSFNKTVIHAKRSDGTITFGTTIHHGTAQVTSNGAIGLRDITADPATTAGGVFLYSKGGLPYIKQADGTVFQVGTGGTAPVTSVNTKTGAVVLAASDVNALPSNADGSTSGRVTSAKGFTVTSTDVNQNPIVSDSPAGQTARLQVMRVNGVDMLSLTAGGALTLAGALTAVGTSQVDNLRVGSAGTFGGAAGSVIAQANATTLPTSNPAGSILYTSGGVPRFRESNGADYAVTPPSDFTPESLGVKAWAGDPGTVASGADYSGVGQGRMTAVYVNRSVSVSKIVWHMQGYAGGLLTGSWAGIYDTAGTLKGATGDMSTATYEPATQSTAGGGWSSSPLTAPVTLTPGIYYVCWRFNYTASPVDGPALTRWDSTGTTNGPMGLGTAVWRFAKFTSSATSAPSTITPSTLFSANGIQFWVALA